MTKKLFCSLLLTHALQSSTARGIFHYKVPTCCRPTSAFVLSLWVYHVCVNGLKRLFWFQKAPIFTMSVLVIAGGKKSKRLVVSFGWFYKTCPKELSLIQSLTKCEIWSQSPLQFSSVMVLNNGQKSTDTEHYVTIKLTFDILNINCHHLILLSWSKFMFSFVIWIWNFYLWLKAFFVRSQWSLNINNKKKF